MNKYIKNFGYLLRHKWYVMKECFRQGLYWRGIMHDNSKILPSEFIPYAKFFARPIVRDTTGYYKPTDTGDKDFDFAWLLHQKRNRHHWQWWILPEDEGGSKVLKMEEPYLTEMICDWVGAGQAQGKFSPKEDKYKETRAWWNANRHKMTFHHETRNKIEARLNP